MAIIVYVSNASNSTEIKKRQQQVAGVLSSLKIPYEVRDIDANESYRQQMHDGAGPDALTPQLYNGDVYLGDFSGFDEAVESEELTTFLLLS
ncbi:glutaredoxin domain-containing protein [Streptomyces sp. NPDC087908]|uniref:glutaredoxin domain-containing protein n=1 Tax=Streptomyces sp. NPDC087908 TaxID=3365820 RepID=UPI00380DAC73